jgi:hypothetical protein
LSHNAILYPIFAMFLLTVIVLGRLGTLRVRAVQKRQVRMRWYRFYQGESGESDQMFFTSRNFINLFEVPVLFYTVSILIYVTDKVDTAFVILAWLFVLGRCAHSYIHVTSNYVPRRFNIYIVTGLILLAMWVRLAYQIVLYG